MEWFNWILRGGGKDVLPELFIDESWLREQYPDEDGARQAIVDLVDAGPYSLGQLHSMNKGSLREYLRKLMACQSMFGIDWLRENRDWVRKAVNGTVRERLDARSEQPARCG